MIKKKRYRRKIDGVQLAATCLILLFSLIVFIPFWNTAVISLETRVAAAQYPFSLIPMEFTLANYEELIKEGRALLNSYWVTIKMTVGGTVTGMAMGVLAAYGFSRQFPGKKLFFRLALFTMFFGGGLVPLYLQLKKMHLLNLLGCTMISMGSVYNVIIMKNGFESVPMELQEAAMIDGANDLFIFVKVMLPLQKPLIATFTLFSIVGYWNNWYWPMIVGGQAGNVLQLYLRKLVNTAETMHSMTSGILQESLSYSEGIKMAAVFVVMLPVMVIYPFLQKHFAKGLLVGAVKM